MDKNKELNPYQVKPLMVNGRRGFWGRGEWCVGYEIFYKDRLFYTMRGYRKEDAENMTAYLNLAYVQGMGRMKEILEKRVRT